MRCSRELVTLCQVHSIEVPAFPMEEDGGDSNSEEADSDDEEMKGGYNSPTFDAYTVPCTSPKGFLDITLGKETSISVPLSHIIIPRNETREECILSILTTSVYLPLPPTNSTSSTNPTNETQPQPPPQTRSETPKKLHTGDTEYFILGAAIMEHTYMLFDHKRTDV
ncbi:hypothetical protein K458DRAFT_65866 [Lentithecium fluviatile CBS 122367]|uniref:Uncharacterized protein n=1 Tax=Lentithecium fluviatile CBS 122367 TaxID=1168545 RepID=A0A6G1JKD6_9PLEO|nr:hypothetical protein K458DRAFT_65866 [Lentithecium fluviatile CBS 122367]